MSSLHHIEHDDRRCDTEIKEQVSKELTSLVSPVTMEHFEVADQEMVRLPNMVEKSFDQNIPGELNADKDSKAFTVSPGNLHSAMPEDETEKICCPEESKEREAKCFSRGEETKRNNASTSYLMNVTDSSDAMNCGGANDSGSELEKRDAFVSETLNHMSELDEKVTTIGPSDYKQMPSSNDEALLLKDS